MPPKASQGARSLGDARRSARGAVAVGPGGVGPSGEVVCGLGSLFQPVKLLPLVPGWIGTGNIWRALQNAKCSVISKLGGFSKQTSLSLKSSPNLSETPLNKDVSKQKHELH